MALVFGNLRFIINDHTLSRKLTDKPGDYQYVIYPGNILNQAAGYVWHHLQNDIDFDDLLANIKDSFQVEDKEEISTTLFQLMNDFVKDNYLSIEKKENSIWKRVNSDILKNFIDSEDSFIKMRGQLDFEPITDVDLVITQKCNFSCNHCFMSSSPESGDKDLIDVAKWKEIIDSLCKLGLSEAKITGGEPFVYPNLFEVLEYLDSKNVGLFILSNGFLLNEEKIKNLAKLKKVIVQISIDGTTNKSHDLLRNTSNSLDTIKENIKLLRKYNIPVIIATTATVHNYQEIMSGHLINLANDLDINILGISPHFIHVGRAIDHTDNQLTDQQILNLINYLNQEKEKNYPFNIHIGAPPALTKESSLKHPNLVLPRCRRGINSCSITSEGLVAVCTDFTKVNYQRYELGNILQDNLDTIWKNAESIRNERINSIDTLKGICSICKYSLHCGGACRADAYAFYQDIDAPYPLCQRLYENNLFPKEAINPQANYLTLEHTPC